MRKQTAVAKRAQTMRALAMWTTTPRRQMKAAKTARTVESEEEAVAAVHVLVRALVRGASKTSRPPRNG
jgi:hypothetical protein